MEDKYSFTVDKLDEGFDVYEITFHWKWQAHRKHPQGLTSIYVLLR